jgi:hypothetical protein
MSDPAATTNDLQTVLDPARQTAFFSTNSQELCTGIPELDPD